MRRTLSKILEQPVYLWLLGIYPILYLYAANLGLVIDREVLFCLCGMLAATTIGFLVANRFIKDRYKTAFILSICSLIFTLSGHVFMAAFMPKSLFVWTLMLSLSAAIIVALLCRSHAQMFFAGAAPISNLIVLALLAIPTFKLVTEYLTMSPYVSPVSTSDISTAAQPKPAKVNDSPTQPDIYYIIPDGYPSDAWLQDKMNYDNSKFTTALEDRGFVVAKHAQSNYGATLMSLASVLNMRYYASNPSSYTNIDYLRLSIADNAVARQFQEIGYTYIQLLSGYLIPSPTADIIRDFTPSGIVEVEIDQNMISTIKLANREPAKIGNHLQLGHFYKRSFISLYVDTTLFRILASQLNKLIIRDESAPYHLYAPERFLTTIDEAGSIASMPEATFAVIHLLKPHWPVTFNEHGEVIEITEPSQQEYFAEFQFTNGKFLEMIDTIMRESLHPPVIIFQSDHGSTYGSTRTEDDKFTHFDIYATYYLSDSYSISLPKSYTSINTFPLIMNEIFGTDYELQNDRLNELLIGYWAPFEQADVTLEFAHK